MQELDIEIEYFAIASRAAPQALLECARPYRGIDR